MLRTSIRLFSSSAVASQRASAEFVVPKSILIMYLLANDNLLASNPHPPARCASAVMEFPLQPGQSPCGQNLAARAANSPPSHASPCVVTRREPEALRLRC